MRLFREIRWMWLILALVLVAPGLTSAAPAKAKAKKKVVTETTQAKTAKTESAFSFKIGDAKFLFGGFVDAIMLFRDTNVGSGIGTSFGSIPFNNAGAGNISEMRLSAQASRFSLKVTDDIGDTNITGFMETDFLGNSASTLNISTNSATLRLRQYWVGLKNGDWEFLAGQAWSWLTTNRKGMSSLPADIYVSRNIDNLFQVGLSYTRATQLRVAYHAGENFTLGLGLENPDQYVGSGVLFSNGNFGVTFSSQFDTTSSSATPNLMPDIIAKIVYDIDNLHVDLAGYMRNFECTFIPIGGTAFEKSYATGVGGALSINAGLTNEVHLIATSFLGTGGGRYLGGLGPDLVVKPDTTTDGVAILPVVSYGGTAGIEAQVTPDTLFAGYFGFVQFDQNSFLDPYSPVVIGFGGMSAPSSANKYIREFSFDWVQTFWKSPTHGSLQFGMQYAFVARNPWYVTPYTPSEAACNMIFTEVKYLLP
jgi:hypothetical protein